MRLLDARVHGVLDIVIVILLITGPLLFGLGGSPAAIAYTLAVVHLVLTLITGFPMGRWKMVPFVVHGIIELGVGVFSCSSCPSSAVTAPALPRGASTRSSGRSCSSSGCSRHTGPRIGPRAEGHPRRHGRLWGQIQKRGVRSKTVINRSFWI